ncbi:hypothetical protein HU200_004546 [Digitaria exilis]|uniref:Extradiol ring-cleavage dioxygenase class III enzyme subunit B domain-containing protein n=1 Tax=Digitaria exilis TaxID=1010633 RepID=A0A835FRJ6_9POAL|nr:hypothetical protein HU200_004546 [Digitaria exilis]
MDTFFLSHGSPTLSIDEAIPARHFFKSWLPARVAGDRTPRAILMVSGHWETATPAVNVIRGTNDTIYDFYGFPKPMYQNQWFGRLTMEFRSAARAPGAARQRQRSCSEQRPDAGTQHRRTVAARLARGRSPALQAAAHPTVQNDSRSQQLKYPAPGAPDLALRTKELLEQAGFGPVKEDHSRGLDHGAWVPLMLMYPDANIPVCQLSVQTDRDGTYHYNLGRALAPLREEGVLILGSGSATHNLRKMGPTNAPVPQWATEFDTWIKDSLLAGRYEDVNRFDEKAPHARTAHPWPDHFYPLHVALGAAGDGAKAEQIHQSWTNATLSYSSYRLAYEYLMICIACAL